MDYCGGYQSPLGWRLGLCVGCPRTPLDGQVATMKPPARLDRQRNTWVCDARFKDQGAETSAHSAAD